MELLLEDGVVFGVYICVVEELFFFLVCYNVVIIELNGEDIVFVCCVFDFVKFYFCSWKLNSFLWNFLDWFNFLGYLVVFMKEMYFYWVGRY